MCWPHAPSLITIPFEIAQTASSAPSVIGTEVGILESGVRASDAFMSLCVRGMQLTHLMTWASFSLACIKRLE